MYEIQYVEKEAMEAYQRASSPMERSTLMGKSQLVEYVFGSGPGRSQLIADEGAPGKVSYARSKGMLQPTVHQRLTYKNAFRNVDLVFSITGDGRCKYDIILHEGAQLSDVDFRIEGLQPSQLKAQGNALVADLEFGRFKEEIPEAYQQKGGERTPRELRYAQDERGHLMFTGSSALERIPQGETLIIDPIGSIEWGTYFAPPGNSTAARIVAQPNDVFYATGGCFSASLVTTGVLYSGSVVYGDVWVAKFQDQDGVLQPSDRLWCTLVGGNDDDVVSDLDACGGTVAICGWTGSEDFPKTDGMPIDLGPTSGVTDPQDGYLVYLDGLTGAITYGTFIGGELENFSSSVAFDCNASTTGTICYVTTSARDWPIDDYGTMMGPPFSYPFQTIPLCFSYNYTILQQYGAGSLNWTTYYSANCSSLPEVSAQNIAVDGNGNVILLSSVTAGTSGSDLGITFNTYLGGYRDYVLSSFAPDASLNWARWWGTPFDDNMLGPVCGIEHSSGLAIGEQNEIYVGGSYSFYGSGFCEQVAYISRIENSPTPNDVWTIDLSVAGDCQTTIHELSMGCQGRIIAVGETNCTTGFATPGANDETFAGGISDGYIAELEDLGTSANINYISYYGGYEQDRISSVDAREKGRVMVCGSTDSPPGSGVDINGLGAWLLSGPGYERAMIARFENECCVAEITIPDGTYSSSMSSTITGQTIRVEGTWHIDQFTELIDCIVYAMTGSQIIVGTGASAGLHLVNTQIESCEDMWMGLRADMGGVRMENSRISDAQYGVDLRDGTYLRAFHSQFTNNYIGVHIAKPPTPDDVNTVGLVLGDCLFATMGTGLKLPYTGQAPMPGKLGFAGISAHNTYLNIVPPAGYADNVFKNLNHGIHTQKTGLVVAGARFENIRADASYGPAPEYGAAIHARGYGGWYSLDQTGKGTGAGDPTTFRNCRWAIWSEAMNLTSQANRIDGLGTMTAYHIRYSGGRYIKVFENVMDVQETGVDLRFNDGAAAVSVRDNTIVFGLTYGDSPSKAAAAIYVRELNGYNADSRITGNQILFRPASGSAFMGIRLIAASHYEVAENAIAMSVQAINQLGINMEGCTWTNLNCNSVIGLGSWSGSWGISPPGQSGIRHSMGDNNSLSCNQVDLLRNGILFNGYAPSTVLQANNFGFHDVGLLLTTGALIGPQVAKGNIWTTACTTLDAEWMGPLPITVSNNRILVNSLLNPLCWPPDIDPPAWFGFYPLPNDECASVMPQCLSSGMQGGGGERDAGMDELVMQGSVQNGLFTSETQWTFAYELYQALLKDSTLYTGGPYTSDFLTLMAASVAGLLRDVEVDRQALYQLPAFVQAAVLQNEVDIALLLGLIEAALIQLAADTLSPAQTAALQANISAWQSSIAALAEYNATAIANADAARQAEALLLQTETGNIASSELIEQNAQAVNAIYLATIAQSGEDVVFDSQQSSTLYSIADQCPLVGGNPVYQARALYALIDEDAEFDDAMLCITEGFVVKNLVEPNLSVRAYPNPNRTGQLFFEIDGLDDGEDRITTVLCDIQGRPVVRQSLAGFKGVVDVSGLAQGLYHWTVLLDGLQIGQGKVTLF